VQPENILLDAEGHVKLTDYGLAKDFTRESKDKLAVEEATRALSSMTTASTDPAGVAITESIACAQVMEESSDEGSFRTKSLCGTDEYLAPEAIAQSGGGYGKSVDWYVLIS
jgi:serine/threonine protein kinase